MTRHIVRSFDEDLTQLADLITQMGGAAEAQLAAALNVIQSRDRQAAEAINQSDKHIDQLEANILDFAVGILARRQPMAGDLRETISALKIATDLERIGDLAKHIAMLIAEVDLALPQAVSGGFRHIGQRALKQVKDVLDAFSSRDPQKALAVWEADQELDTFYQSMIRELLTYMLEDHQAISFCIDLIFAVKYIERIGDHSTNIAENIIYAITGKLPMDRPKGKKIKHT